MLQATKKEDHETWPSLVDVSRLLLGLRRILEPSLLHILVDFLRGLAVRALRKGISVLVCHEHSPLSMGIQRPRRNEVASFYLTRFTRDVCQ